MANMPPLPPEPGKIPSPAPLASLSATSKNSAPWSAPQNSKLTFNPKKFERASVLPIVIAILAIGLSTLIWFINRHSSMALSAIGYLLSPLAVIMALGLDNFLQRTHTSKGEWFVPNQSYGRVLRFLTGLALILSYPHISGLADHISAWLAQTFPWMAS